MTEMSSSPYSEFEQLKLPIPPPLLVWSASNESSGPLITRETIRDFSRERTGKTNLGTRIANSIEKALGYNPYYNPAPEGYSPDEVISVLEEARDYPDDQPFWWLGIASMKLFQQYCDEVASQLAIK